MRCHRGFWAYAGEVGAEISASAARFAREQAAQDPPGANKAAEDWLRSRAGRTLKDKWLAEADAVRDKYIQNNNDVGFPLDEFPKGIADGRRDRRRYPRMVRADVTTPQIVQEPSAPVQAGTSYESQGAVQVESFNTYRRELVRAAFAAEITALAHAVKERQIEEAVNHSAAVVECMGAQIASGLSPAARQRVVGIASDVAGYVRAATTQMMMYTDAEAAAAIDESVARVKSADESLSNYIRESILTDDTFKAMYRDREGYQVVSTKHLRNFSWLGEGTNSTTPESTASSADGVPTCEAVAEVETSRASVDNERKRPRVSKRMRSRDIDTDHGKQIVEGADSALTDRTIVGSGGYPEIEVGGSTGCDIAGACDINDEIMSNSEENDNVESESADEEESQDVIEYQSSDSKSSDSSGGSLYEENSAEKAGQADRGVPRRRGLREQLSKEVALFEWMDFQDGGDPRSIHIYRDDLDSLLPFSSMTGTVLGYFIYRDMVKQNGLVCSYGTSLYLSMEVARFTRNPKKKLRLPKDLIKQSDWKTYRYVLFPVSGRNHWSLLVIENPFNSEPTKVYHINSMRRAHSSAYAFDVAKWLLTKLHEMESGSQAAFVWSTCVLYTRPQQSNSVDCGLYVLHYMEVISNHIAATAPLSIEDNISEWTSGCFNVTKAAAYRSQLYNRVARGPQQGK